MHSPARAHAGETASRTTARRAESYVRPHMIARMLNTNHDRNAAEMADFVAVSERNSL